MGNSADLHARHQKVMPSWMALYYEEPIALDRGEGCWVWDVDENRYLDLFGGILTTMTAHALPEVVEAVQEQAGKMLHSSTLYLIRQQIELAERVADLAPVDDPKVLFTTSGTEANDGAMMLATGYRRSNQVIALRNSYHGRSFAAVGVTGNRGWSASSLTPVNVSWIHGARRHQGPLSELDDAAYIDACVEDLRDVLETTTAGDVACMIAEPIQGVGGFTVPPAGLYGRLKEVLDEHGILFIADEVQTGWGRTGENFWGIDAHGVRPHMMTFAKGLGNGLAMAGVVAESQIMDSLPANSISTFGGNPLSCAGALANLAYALDHDLQGNALKMGNMMMERLRAEIGELDMVADIRGKGLMIGIELVNAADGTPNAAAATAVLEECKRLGVLVGKGGLYGNALRIAPPMTINTEEVGIGLDALISGIKTVDQSMSPATTAGV